MEELREDDKRGIWRRKREIEDGEGGERRKIGEMKDEERREKNDRRGGGR